MMDQLILNRVSSKVYIGLLDIRLFPYLSLEIEGPHNLEPLYQQNQQKRMFTRLQHLFHFDLHSVKDLDSLLTCSTRNDQQEPQIKLTIQHKETMQEEVQTRSLKNNCPHNEISFGQNILKEHMGVFLSEYKKCESMFEKIKLSSQSKKMSVKEIINYNLKNLTKLQKSQFIQDLQHQIKFYEFLNYIAQICSFEITVSLINIAHEIWQEYVPFQLIEQEINDLMAFAQQVALRQINKKRECQHPFIQLQQGYQEKQKYLHFIEIFSATIILIIAQYYQNPYFNESSEISEDKIKQTDCLFHMEIENIQGNCYQLSKYQDNVQP